MPSLECTALAPRLQDRAPFPRETFRRMPSQPGHYIPGYMRAALFTQVISARRNLSGCRQTAFSQVLFRLSNRDGSPLDPCCAYLLSEQTPTKDAIDLIEITFGVANTIARRMEKHKLAQ
jgi:hypothetical protein